MNSVDLFTEDAAVGTAGAALDTETNFLTGSEDLTPHDPHAEPRQQRKQHKDQRKRNQIRATIIRPASHAVTLSPVRQFPERHRLQDRTIRP